MGTIELGPDAASRALVRGFGETAFRVPAYGQELALSPDESLLATGGERTVTLLDARTGETLRRLALDADAASDRVCFSVDGARLFVAGFRPLVTILDGRTLETVGVLPTGHRNVTALAASPREPHVLFTGGFDGHAKLWDTREGTVITAFPFAARHASAPECYVSRAVFSPDGNTLLTVTYDGGDLWALPLGTHVASVAPGFGLCGAAYTPDGARLLVCNNTGHFAWADPRTGAMEPPLQVLPSRCAAHAMAFTQDATVVVSGAEDGSVRVISTSDLTPLRASPRGPSLCTSLALSRDDETVYLNDGNASIVRVSVAQATVRHPALAGGVLAVALDGDTAVALLRFGTVLRCALSTGALAVTRFDGGYEGALSPRGRRARLSPSRQSPAYLEVDCVRSEAAPSDADGLGAVDDAGAHAFAEKGAVLYGTPGVRIEAPAVRRHAQLRFSPDGRWLVARSNTALTRIDTRAGAVCETRKVPRGDNLTVDNHGRVTVCSGARLVLLDGAKPLVLTFKGLQFWNVATSDDGAIIAASTTSGELVLVRRSHPKAPVLVRASSERIDCLALSADGRQVIVGGADPRVRVHDVEALCAAPEAPARARTGRARSKPA